MTKKGVKTVDGLSGESRDQLTGAVSEAPRSAGGILQRIGSIAAFSAAAVLSGCIATDEVSEKALSDQIVSLQANLSRCQDKSLEVGNDTAILGYGTFGLHLLKSEIEHRFSISKNSESEVEYTFLIWPPVNSVEEITVEGMTENFSKARLGSYWAVVYKSKVPQNKETLVIEVREKRFVIFIDRK